jgi:hypothetical protein
MPSSSNSRQLLVAWLMDGLIIMSSKTSARPAGSVPVLAQQ